MEINIWWISSGLAILGLVFAIGTWVGSVNTDRSDFRSFTQEIRSDIKKILTRLPPVPTTSASPIRLTDLGEQISQMINAVKWATETAEILIGQAEEMDSFEIQNLSFEYARAFTPDGVLLKKMHTCAFEKGVDLSGIREVLGVELRDILLGHHDLEQSSLDRHT